MDEWSEAKKTSHQESGQVRVDLPTLILQCNIFVEEC